MVAQKQNMYPMCFIWRWESPTAKPGKVLSILCKIPDLELYQKGPQPWRRSGQWWGLGLRRQGQPVGLRKVQYEHEVSPNLQELFIGFPGTITAIFPQKGEHPDAWVYPHQRSREAGFPCNELETFADMTAPALPSLEANGLSFQVGWVIIINNNISQLLAVLCQVLCPAFHMPYIMLSSLTVLWHLLLILQKQKLRELSNLPKSQGWQVEDQGANLPLTPEACLSASQPPLSGTALLLNEDPCP